MTLVKLGCPAWPGSAVVRRELPGLSGGSGCGGSDGVGGLRLRLSGRGRAASIGRTLDHVPETGGTMSKARSKRARISRSRGLGRDGPLLPGAGPSRRTDASPAPDARGRSRLSSLAGGDQTSRGRRRARTLALRHPSDREPTSRRSGEPSTSCTPAAGAEQSPPFSSARDASCSHPSPVEAFDAMIMHDLHRPPFGLKAAARGSSCLLSPYSRRSSYRSVSRPRGIPRCLTASDAVRETRPA
jgi:hypothetical protein